MSINNKRAIDYLINLLNIGLIAPLKKQAFSNYKTIQRIGFIHIGGLGDYLLFSPVIKLFRNKYPNAQLSLMTGPNFNAVKGLFPELDEIIIVESSNQCYISWFKRLRQGHYDALIINYEFLIPAQILSWAIALSGIPIRIGCSRNTFREKVLTASVKDMLEHSNQYLMDTFAMLPAAFFQVTGQSVDFHLQDLYHYTVPLPDHQQAMDLLSAYEPCPSTHRVFIHPGTSKTSKQEQWTKSWPPDYWSQFIYRFIQEYSEAVIYLTGGPDNAEEIQAIESELAMLPLQQRERIINLFGKIPSIECLAALIALSDVFVGCDSFAMHLATYVGTPLVAIFGLTNERRFLMQREKCLVAAREELPCRPCLLITRQTSCTAPICLEVPVQVVLEKVKAHLNCYAPLLPV